MSQAYLDWLVGRKEGLCDDYRRELTEQTMTAFESSREYMLEVEAKIEFLEESTGLSRDGFLDRFEDALITAEDFVPGPPVFTEVMITLADGSTQLIEQRITVTAPPSFEEAASGLEINEAFKEACVEDEEEFAEDQRAIDELDRQLMILLFIEMEQKAACEMHEASLMSIADQMADLEAA
jgi:hypothetical protein